MKSRQSSVALLSLAFILSATPVPAAELNVPTQIPKTSSMTAANLVSAEGNAQANVNAKNAYLDEAQTDQATAAVPIQSVVYHAGGSSYIRVDFASDESLDTFTLSSGGNGGGSVYTVNRVDQTITYRYFPSGTPDPVTLHPGEAEYDTVLGYILSDLLEASGSVWQAYYVNDGSTDSELLQAAKAKTQELYLAMAGLPKETHDKHGRVIASETYDFATDTTVKTTYKYGAGNQVIRSTTEKYRDGVLVSKHVVRHTIGGTRYRNSYYENGQLWLVESSFVLRNGVKASNLRVYFAFGTTLRQSVLKEIFNPITGKIQKSVLTLYDSMGRPDQKTTKTYNAKGILIKEKTITIPKH